MWDKGIMENVTANHRVLLWFFSCLFIYFLKGGNKSERSWLRFLPYIFFAAARSSIFLAGLNRVSGQFRLPPPSPIPAHILQHMMLSSQPWLGKHISSLSPPLPAPASHRLCQDIRMTNICAAQNLVGYFLTKQLESMKPEWWHTTNLKDLVWMHLAFQEAVSHATRKKMSLRI